MMEYPKYKKVLFCTDFSENSDYAFEFAFGIAKRDDGLLYILHVIPRIPNQEMLKTYVPMDTWVNIQKELLMCTRTISMCSCTYSEIAYICILSPYILSTLWILPKSYNNFRLTAGSAIVNLMAAGI